MVAPEPNFTYRPPSTAAPFALGYLGRYPLRRLADDLGAASRSQRPRASIERAA